MKDCRTKITVRVPIPLRNMVDAYAMATDQTRQDVLEESLNHGMTALLEDAHPNTYELVQMMVSARATKGDPT